MKTFVKLCCGILIFGMVLTGIGVACHGSFAALSNVSSVRWASQTLRDTLHRAFYRGCRGWDLPGAIGNRIEDYFDHFEDIGEHWSDRFADDVEAGIERSVGRFEDYADHWSDWGDRFDDYDDSWDDEYSADWDDSDWGDNTATATLPSDQQKQVTKIKLELSEGEFYISTLPEEDIDNFTVSGTYFKRLWTTFDNGEWKVEAKGDKRYSDPFIIYLPENRSFEKIDIELGAGSLVSDNLTTLTFDLEVGAGEATIHTLDFQKANVEVGAGEVTLWLRDKWEKYGYQAEAGLGTISINDNALIAGVGESKRKGTPMIDMEAGAGSIYIYTDE